MAIKLFCNTCERFIKNLKPVEIADYRDGAMCSECEKRINGLYLKIEKLRDSTTHRLNKILDKAKAELELLLKNVVQIEADEDKE